MVVDQSVNMVTGTALSGASPLPHLFHASHKYVHTNVTIGAIYVCNICMLAP